MTMSKAEREFNFWEGLAPFAGGALIGAVLSAIFIGWVPALIAVSITITFVLLIASVRWVFP